MGLFLVQKSRAHWPPDIDAPRVRAWILEELYIEGLRSNTIDEHGPALLTPERRNASIFQVPAEPESQLY